MLYLGTLGHTFAYRAEGLPVAFDCVFLGGAAGVGASCLAFRLGERWIVVDAGVRVGAPPDQRLPDLAFLADKDVVAILITHAHADHIGALPLLRERFPTVPIYASPATIALMRVMFADALRIMARRAAEELEVPLFDDALVAATLRRLRPLPTGTPRVLPGLPSLKVTTVPAGHIAGATSLAMQTPEGYVVVSGDLSCAPQRTVPPATSPKQRDPDLLILESTYGGRTHPDRREEERRLAHAVAGHIQAGRHCLIPAFALGRAQEIMIILRTAQEKNLVPRFPVWVDGLIRQVCDVYTTIPEALTPPLQHRIRSGVNPFFFRGIRPVETPDQRWAILDGPPCCIISSSGMLTGGPSAFYARHLVGQPNAAILITGYQDEESPGRQLLAVAARQEGTLTIGGVRQAVQCQVETYALSGHADQAELAAYVRTLRPAQVALVHGDTDARAALADHLRMQGDTVRCPADGEMIAITPRPGSTPAIAHGPLSDAPPAQRNAVPVDRVPQVVSPAPAIIDLTTADTVPPAQPLTQFVASQIAHAVLNGAATRIGVHPHQPATFVIRFPLPEVDRERYATQLAEVAIRTGWTVTVHPNAQMQALLAALPPDLALARSPSVYQEQRQVMVYCDEPVDATAEHEYTTAFAAATGGWQLIIRSADQGAVT